MGRISGEPDQNYKPSTILWDSANSTTFALEGNKNLGSMYVQVLDDVGNSLGTSTHPLYAQLTTEPTINIGSVGLTDGTNTANVLKSDSSAAGQNAQMVVDIRKTDFPDSNIIFDDKFDNGTCGWTELYQFASDWNTQRYLPITLSPQGIYGKYALKLQTNSNPSVSFAGGAQAIKRSMHQITPLDPLNTAKMKVEFWFSFGSDGIGVTGFDSASPRSILLNVDSEYSDNTTTSNTGIGRRALFQATWQQSVWNGSVNNYTGQWFLSQGSGHNYGDVGYISPASMSFFATGYYTNFPFNQNKGNTQYVAFTLDVYNGLWLTMQVNTLLYDLTKLPSNSNGPLASLVATGDPTYNFNEFIGGLNVYVGINNVLTAGQSTASWLKLHRSRLSYI